MGWWSRETVAVVTGSNKGVGYGVVRELARRGITSVLTARNPALGLAAMDAALRMEPELSGFLHFHQLDIADANSVTEFASWIRSEFGGIDIFINNAAIQLFSTMAAYEDAVEMLRVNYYGAKQVTEALLPLLRASSHGARVLEISSGNGQLKFFEYNKFVITKVKEAVDSLDKNMVDAIAAKYLNDVKAGRAKEENWVVDRPQYRESKLLLNTYTRVLAQEVSNRPEGHQVFVNALCPGSVDTDMSKKFLEKIGKSKEELSLPNGLKFQTPDEAAQAILWLALLPKENYPSGKFFQNMQEICF